MYTTLLHLVNYYYNVQTAQHNYEMWSFWPEILEYQEYLNCLSLTSTLDGIQRWALAWTSQKHPREMDGEPVSAYEHFRISALHWMKDATLPPEAKLSSKTFP